MNTGFLGRSAAGFGGSLVLGLIAFLGEANATISPFIWTPVGASPTTQGQVENIPNGEVDGAIQAIAPHPTEPNVLYIGAVNGGIWRTENAFDPRPVWKELLDNSTSLSISALEFDPTDQTHRTLVAGFGFTSSFGKVGTDLDGLLRTTDGGNSWVHIPPPSTLGPLEITSIAPNGLTLVVGTKQSGAMLVDLTPGTWTALSGPSEDQLPVGSVIDMVAVAGAPGTLYAFIAGHGLFKSESSGLRWADANAPQLKSAAQSASNARLATSRQGNVYVAIVASTGLSSIFHSRDGAASWEPLDIPMIREADGISYGIHPGSQGQNNLSLVADPNSPNLIYIGGDRQPAGNELATHQNNPPETSWPNALHASNYTGRLFRIDASAARGSQVSPITHVGTLSNSAPHADSRQMRFTANHVLLESDDGGIYRRDEPGTSSGDWHSLIGNLQISEFHSVAWDANSHVLIAGAQDTGATVEHADGNAQWDEREQGDGGFVAVDTTTVPGSSTRYFSSWNLINFRREQYDASNNYLGRNFLSPVLDSNPEGQLEPQFYTPVVLNAVDQHRLLIASAKGLYESLDKGDSATFIGPVVPTDANMIVYGGKGSVGLVYVANQADSNVYLRTGEGQKLAVIPGYPGRSTVMALCIDKLDPSTVYAVDQAHVFSGQSFGKKWSDITGDLATLAPGDLHSCAFVSDPKFTGLVVGTLRGAFGLQKKAQASWTRFGQGLPKVIVTHLEYSSTDRVLAAGTLGRGGWVVRFGANVAFAP
jgi:photosystem II stability/assembly factor-like uncharacterized protein